MAYNRLNGEFGSENKKVLNDILRDEWGYEGLVVTDWGATNDRVKGLEAGQDLEMPSSEASMTVRYWRLCRKERFLKHRWMFQFAVCLS